MGERRGDADLGGSEPGAGKGERLTCEAPKAGGGMDAPRRAEMLLGGSEPFAGTGERGPVGGRLARPARGGCALGDGGALSRPARAGSGGGGSRGGCRAGARGVGGRLAG